MKLFDRFTGKTIDTDIVSISGDVHLGRYYILDGPNKSMDMTQRLYHRSDLLYHQSILDDNYSYKVLLQIKRDSENNKLDSIPFIQGVDKDIELSPFEEKLLKKLKDIRHMCIEPAYALDREIQKVNINKAKRISYRGYEYLASHTEDWNYKSIVSFKPNRILSEILDENTNIYENRLLVAFVKRSILYLETRINALKEIDDFFKEYLKCMEDMKNSSSNFDKLNRSIKLYKYAYNKTEDANNKSEVNDRRKQGKDSKSRLQQACDFLSKYTTCPVFQEIKFNKNDKIAYHDTNILLNDKYYRSLRMLWKEFDKDNKEETTEEIIYREQEIIDSIRIYAMTLIVYTCKESLNYKISEIGKINEWIANNGYLPIIHAFFDENKVIILEIGFNTNYYKIKLIVSGSDYKILSDNLKDNEFILAYGDNTIEDDKIISISAKKVDSVERIGTLIRQYIVKYIYNFVIKKEYEVNISEIINHIDLLEFQFINNIKYNKYLYTKYPSIIDKEKAIIEFDNHKATLELKRKKKKDYKKEQYVNTVYEKVKRRYLEVIDNINDNSKLFQQYLVCPICGKKYKKEDITSLRKFKCNNQSCNFILEISDNMISLHPELIKNNIDGLKVYYGMDYITIKI